MVFGSLTEQYHFHLILKIQCNLSPILTPPNYQGWLAADFQKERERHRANAKKISKAVDLFHKSKESKKIKKAKVNE